MDGNIFPHVKYQTISNIYRPLQKISKPTHRSRFPQAYTIDHLFSYFSVYFGGGGKQLKSFFQPFPPNSALSLSLPFKKGDEIILSLCIEKCGLYMGLPNGTLVLAVA